MTWLKKYWLKLLVLILIPILLLFYFSPLTIAKIKYDFNKAFTYRLTGDCVAFSEYINRDQDDWRKRCEEEKGRGNAPIRNYKILRVSNKLTSDKAFIQVQLTRDNPVENNDRTYSATYEVRRVGLKWKIDQEIQ